MEVVQLLPSNMSHSLQLLISLSEKARHNRSNCNNLVGQLKFLKPLFNVMNSLDWSGCAFPLGLKHSMAKLNKCRHQVRIGQEGNLALYG